jgi:hypothetical protein
MRNPQLNVRLAPADIELARHEAARLGWSQARLISELLRRAAQLRIEVREEVA